jgi:hypothetical protein
LLFVPVIGFAQKSGASFSSFKDDSLKVVAMFPEARKYIVALDKRGTEMMQQIIKTSEGKSSPFFLKYYAEALGAIASFYRNSGNYEQAAIYYNREMQFAIDNKIDLYVAKANLGLGIVADHKADYETSIDRNLKALIL